MTLLVASLVVLALGPLLLALAGKSASALRFLDGFIFVAIAGLVMVHVLPETLEQAGWMALVAAVFGLLGPTVVERHLERSARRAHDVALLMACVALAIHALLDGVALATADEGRAGLGMGLAVVLHRLPVGLTLWWLLQPVHGRGAAGLALLGLGGATVAGFTLGGPVGTLLQAEGLGLFYALVGGSLLHVVIHRPHPIAEGSPSGTLRFASVLGGAVGVLFLLQLQSSEGGAHSSVSPHSSPGFWEIFVDLTMESAPALVLAYFAAGLVQAWLPKASTEWMGRGSAPTQALKGVAFGLPLPICSCGVVPVYRSLVSQGAPPTAAMAFLVATPELGLDAVILSVPLLGGEMTVVRVVAAAVVALIVGWAVGSFASSSGRHVAGCSALEGPAPATLRDRLRTTLHSGFVEVVDSTAPWIVAGLAIAAACQPLLEASWISELAPQLEVAFFAILGIPVYVCASGATPLVAVLLAEGVSPGAGLAFLLAGPATNVTTFGVLKDLHGIGVAAAFAGAMAGLCLAIGLLVNAVLPNVGAGAFVPGHDHGHSLLQQLATVGFALLCLGSLLRLGTRGFFASVLAQAGEHDDHDGHDHAGHDHGAGESHDHGPDESESSGGGCCA